MSDQNDRRLIEDYLPIKAISAEASREKSVRKGHISTLHLWWARRPLVACRAAVFGALVNADCFQPKNGSPEKQKSLGRANAAKFIERLCKYPGHTAVIEEAKRYILEAHAERLTKETGQKVTREDIEEGLAPRPKVLDMFAGGGAIPLEALRLGCDAYALDLNPVAHIIELCTLVYPQKYGKPDPTARGMTGPKNEKGETTWGGLAEEVRYWGKWILEIAWKEIGDLYPLIPDPEYKEKENKEDKNDKCLQYLQKNFFRNDLNKHTDKTLIPQGEEIPAGYLMPVAYLWTRTVRCKNPTCGAIVPLVKQTWLCKKKGRYVALKITTSPDSKNISSKKDISKEEFLDKNVKFKVIEATTEEGLGFDPSFGSKGGNATCPFCGTVADSHYVKNEGQSEHLSHQLMAIVYSRPNMQGKVYISANDVFSFIPDEKSIYNKINTLCAQKVITVPKELMPPKGTLGFRVQPYGFKSWSDIFTSRQILCLLTFAFIVNKAEKEMQQKKYNSNLRNAVTTMLASILDRLADFNSSLCVFNYTGGRGVVHTFGRQALPMVWDFAETNPFNPDGASWVSGIEDVPAGLRDAEIPINAVVMRGSATSLPWTKFYFDAIITDPPYYDNVPYADLSDFFYVWLKRTIGHLYPEHFAAEQTPKKKEIVANAIRHNGNNKKAKCAYETMMFQSFTEASRVLKPTGYLVIVYAHKTTLGWSTLVDALRKAGFTVTEAWPIDTEKPGRLRAQESAALASSIFLVAQKCNSVEIGSYENDVRQELDLIIKERVKTLWKMGITGADLVISAIGAGLRAFTRFARVEYANGEEVPTEKFLAEVETLVLETILKRLSKEAGVNGGQYSLSGVDPATRFYILWRYTYKYSVLDAGEAIVFANGNHVELDGPNGLSTGAKALLEKKKGKYRLKDYTDRGYDKKLGLMEEDSQQPGIIDTLHRTLWLMKNKPADLPEYLQEAKPNREPMRLVAQVLAGPALKGGEMGSVSPQAEMSALTELTSNWKSVIEGALFTPEIKKAREAGQIPLFEGEKES